MSLEILLEAALYLEYQTEAHKRGEVPKDYKTFSALQSNASPPASTTPPRPSLPPPPPPAPHNTPIAVHPSKANHVNGVGGPPVGKMPPGSPPYSASYHPDGSYLAARLTAPASAAASNGSVVASPDSSAFIKVKNVPLTLSAAAPLPSTPPMPVSLPSSYAPTSSSNSSSPSSSAGGVGSSNGGNISPQDLKSSLTGNCFASSAGTREVHNKLEKNRRAHLKECFELLRRQLPPCGHDDKKPSNLTVLHSAIRYIQTLKRKERDYEHEMERLAREKISFQQRLSSLKKEISSQYDSVDFAALLPDVPPPSALKAPQVHLGAGSLSKPPPFDSDDDFEFEEEDESLRHKPSPVSPQHSASTSTASERGHLSDVEDLTTTNSRPGSSRDMIHSPPLLLAATNPNSLRPSAVVEHPGRDLRTELSRPLVVTSAEAMRKSTLVNSIAPEMMTIPSVGTKLHLTQQISPLQLSQVTNKHIGDHISRQSHVQLVSSPTGLITSCPTTLVGPAIQLLTAPSGLRMLTATSVDQRHPVTRDDASKPKLGPFITTPESSNSSRLPGGAEINVISSTIASSINSSMGTAAAVGLIRGSSKPINLSASASKTHLSTPVLNGGVISHAPSLHRPILPPGQSGTTVLSTVPSGATPAMGMPHTVTHHLSQATGITHVVTASGAAHISTLSPLVAAPVTMVAPGNHPSGVHILTTGKPPFQVVSGPILKHQVLPQAYLSGQIVKPVMMVSSAASVVTTTRPHSAELATNGSIPTKGVNPS